MMQVVCCECGADSILDGRCVGCNRVRPSSKEIIERINRLTKELGENLEDLGNAIKMEQEDRDEMSTQ